MVLPRAQINLRGIEGDTPTASVVLRRGDGEPMEVTKIDNTDDRLIISTEKVDEERQVGRQKARPGDVILTVTTKPDQKAVSASGRFRVRTNHPDARPIDMPYGIRLLPLIEARLLASAMVLGLVVDTLLLASGWIAYPNGQWIPALAPYWIVAMWILFATTINVGMRWLKKNWILTSVTGSQGGGLQLGGGGPCGTQMSPHCAELGSEKQASIPGAGVS